LVVKTASKNAAILSPVSAVPRQPSIECCIMLVEKKADQFLGWNSNRTHQNES
jgi:hypothetical protein